MVAQLQYATGVYRPAFSTKFAEKPPNKQRALTAQQYPPRAPALAPNDARDIQAA